MEKVQKINTRLKNGVPATWNQSRPLKNISSAHHQVFMIVTSHFSAVMFCNNLFDTQIF